jgi:L-ascorbate metabolism protein UlaG (beta-lactamase superfamily)
MLRLPRPTWMLSLKTLARCGSMGYRGPRSDHFDGERFHNIHPKPHKSLRDVLRWQLQRARQEPWRWQPGPDADPVEARVDGERLRITYINHATLLIQQHGLNILTDPLWGPRASPLGCIGPRRYQAPGLAIEQLPPIDLILVSHNHYDHLDLHSLRLLAARFPQARVITGLGNAALIRQTGFAEVEELDWWQHLALNPQLRLHAVPAQHWSARARADTNRTLWLGFVLESAQGPLLFPGDTGLGPEFALIRQRFGPLRCALLPIGAYAPRWFMRDNHMNPDDAVQAHRILEAQQSIAIHFGTFNLSDEGQFDPPRELQIALQEQGVDPATFAVPQPGQAWEITPLEPLRRADQPPAG